MLSFAEGPPVALLTPFVFGVESVPFGIPLVRGTAEGILEQVEREISRRAVEHNQYRILQGDLTPRCVAKAESS